MILLCTAAFALTLDEAVRRAADVDPDGLVAALEARQARLDAAESWTALGLTPSLRLRRQWQGGASTVDNRFSVSAGLLDASAWFDALQESSQARALSLGAEATRLDVQYAAAALYVAAWEAREALAAARLGEESATATLETVRARAAAGLDEELVLRAAEAARLLATAEREAAAADAAVAEVLLARALELDELGELSPPQGLALPEGGAASPWLAAAKAEVEAARLGHLQDLAGWLPTGSLSASTALEPMDWAVTLDATWTFDGLAGPVLRERHAALAVKIAQIEYDALRRDFDAELAAASARAEAAQRVSAAHQAREAASASALQTGQARLTAGLLSPLEVLRLQDDLAEARAARVAAELSERLAVLQARRAAGLDW